MSRKDYIVIAAALREAVVNADAAGDPREKLGARNAAALVAKALAQDNPRFDRERFLTAAGF